MPPSQAGAAATRAHTAASKPAHRLETNGTRRPPTVSAPVSIATVGACRACAIAAFQSSGKRPGARALSLPLPSGTNATE